LINGTSNKRGSVFRDSGRYLEMPVWVFALLLMLASPPQQVFAIQRVTEYQVKAAYLYHFAQFVEWPASAFTEPDTAFNLCVMGVDPFGEAALTPLAKRSHYGHPIAIRYPTTAREARSCHLLYIASSEAGREAAILETLSDVPVLTISSLPGFVERGGIIGFIRVDNRVRFAINRTASKRQGLSCGAKLLEVAIRVMPTTHREE